MRVVYFQSPEGHSNFGDAINLVIWDRLFNPSMSVYQPNTLFLGIGTLLNAETPIPEAEQYIVYGAGAGYGPPRKLDDRWKVYAVRGPKTAELLGLDPKLAITDPAILMSKWWAVEDDADLTSFMPRWDTMSVLGEKGVKACRDVGLHVIDPRAPVEKVMWELTNTQHLITEALHGAVVADALGIPWTPVKYFEGHDFKWQDWCASVELPYEPVNITQVPLGSLVWDGKPYLSKAAVRRDRHARMLAAAERMYRDVSR